MGTRHCCTFNPRTHLCFPNDAISHIAHSGAYTGANCVTDSVTDSFTHCITHRSANSRPDTCTHRCAHRLANTCTNSNAHSNSDFAHCVSNISTDEKSNSSADSVTDIVADLCTDHWTDGPNDGISNAHSYNGRADCDVCASVVCTDNTGSDQHCTHGDASFVAPNHTSAVDQSTRQHGANHECSLDVRALDRSQST